MRTWRMPGRDRLAVLAAFAAPPAVAAITVPWRASFPNTDAALLLILVVVAVAANGYRLAGYVAAVSAAIWFDFFLTRPYERFTILRGADIRRPCRCGHRGSGHRARGLGRRQDAAARRRAWTWRGSAPPRRRWWSAAPRRT